MLLLLQLQQPARITESLQPEIETDTQFVLCCILIIGYCQREGESALIKKKIKFSSYIWKFRMNEWMNFIFFFIRMHHWWVQVKFTRSFCWGWCGWRGRSESTKNTIMTECTQESGRRLSMYSLVCDSVTQVVQSGSVHGCFRIGPLDQTWVLFL